jgi:uncharacterized protein YbjT (DUF2867 family)
LPRLSEEERGHEDRCGTGLIGSKSAPLLRSRGHEVLQASPSKGVNAVRFDDWLGRPAA